MQDLQFSMEFDVRDYECDMQGVVNNSVYQNYLEHTRHKYLQEIGLDFAMLTEKGILQKGQCSKSRFLKNYQRCLKIIHEIHVRNATKS